MERSEVPHDSQNCANPTNFGDVNITCVDGTTWSILEPLSNGKSQHNHPPFEATRVHRCVCIKDPDGKYSGIKDAVVKIKYQIHGNPSAIKDYGDWKIQLENDARKFPGDKGVTEKLHEVKELIHAAKHPVDMPNSDTMNEFHALDILNKGKSAYTPHLLTWAYSRVWEEIDILGMVGGYMLFTVMTKLPARRIDYKDFWGFTLSKRDEIRAAFKLAQMDIWSHGIYPLDMALRNIMWDDEAGKCYILDFENVDAVHYEDPASEWDDGLFSVWGISESCQGMICPR